MTVKYFKYPFGVNGDLLTIPNPTQVSGVVSYQAGFPIDYQLVDTDPSSLNIQRNQFNQLMFDTTGAIQQLQQNGFPIHITAAMNDGVAYGYDKNSYVRATDGNVYYSLINANTDTPPTSNWQLAGSEVLQYFNFAVDTGIADHYVIAPDPAVTAYADGDFILLRPAHANTGACDINVNSLGVIPIKTMANVNPAAGMIIPTGAYILMYFGGVFVLCNPYFGSIVSKINTRIITSSTTYTKPANLVQAIVETLGAGAGGGGASQAGSAGGGGGAGSYSKSILSAAAIGASQAVTIGAAGTGGASAHGTGGTGGATSFGSLVVSNGGLGGVGSSFGSGGGVVLGGVGGAAGTGDIAVQGAAGLSGTYSTSIGATDGNGANTIYGSGGANLGGNTGGSVGNTGNGFGSGGGGASGHAGAAAGGAGAPGVCIITEYLSQ